ncbi:MAG: DNA-binding protein [Burkholderiales bacterium]|nr:DUF296 domain-containing protein [Burkholderiales bacterium]MDE2286922.1 DNA-binding protein [Burkholderiales bacterium]
MNELAPADVAIEPGTLGRLVVARLKPDQDLTESLETLCAEHGIGRAVVRGAVGSLVDARLAHRVGDDWRERVVAGPGIEILNVFGEAGASSDGRAPVLHGVVADTDGRIYAGRFVRGANRCFITIEVTLQEWLPGGA